MGRRNKAKATGLSDDCPVDVQAIIAERGDLLKEMRREQVATVAKNVGVMVSGSLGGCGIKSLLILHDEIGGSRSLISDMSRERIRALLTEFLERLP